MAKKEGKSKEARSKNIVKKSGLMKKQNLTKRSTVKTELNNIANFFIEPSQNFDIKNLRSTQNSPLISSNTSMCKERQNDALSKDFRKKVKQNQGDSNNETDNKKPFDKKRFRLKKYSKKYKLQQWEEKRKKSLLHKYKKSMKNANEPKLDLAKIYEDLDLAELKTKIVASNENSVDADCENLQKMTNIKPHLKPHEHYQQIREEKQKKIEENERKKIESEEARKRAHKQRMERNKKLKQKTKKGQPIMKYRIEMLLEKIEKNLKK